MSRVQTLSNKPSDKWEQQQEEEEEQNNEVAEEEEEEEPLTEGEEQEDRDDSSRSSSHIFASSPTGSWSSQDTEVTSTPVLSVHPLSPVSIVSFSCYFIETRNRTSKYKPLNRLKTFSGNGAYK